MIVVSDTTPLRYLIEIGEVDILPRLFGQVVTTPAVIRELAGAASPTAVSDWAANPPMWLLVRSPREQLVFDRPLGPGESEAISLAVELAPSRVLIDDRAGHRIAQQFSLRALRTLSVLWIASELQLVDLSGAIARLAKTSYRVDSATLARYAQQDPKLAELLAAEFASIREDLAKGGGSSPDRA